MKIIINPPKEEFMANKLLRTCYTERQLEAIYELLLDDKLGARVAKMLASRDLITIDIEENSLAGPLGWSFGYTEMMYVIDIIGESNETSHLSS